MKKIVSFLSVLFLLVSCGGSSTKGELVGVRGKKWHPEKPFGMTIIPGGSFIMGKSEEDKAHLDNAPTKTVTVRSFYMDETEITNSEYRQFVHWVRDSVIRTNLAELADELGKTQSEDGGIGDYAFVDANTEEMTPYQKYMYENYTSLSDDNEGRALNKKVDLIWDTSKYPDEYYTEVMDSMYLPLEESYNGKRSFDVDKFQFKSRWMDIQKAARSKKKSRKDFIKEVIVTVYPDTTVWIKDFSYSYNEPMHNDYFWHSAYDDYPVVGVNWHQATAFCRWRTIEKNTYQKQMDFEFVNQFRLPTEAEWEYAARGGLESAMYPWGGPYVVNERGCFMANFKPLRGDYAADNFLYTVEGKAFEPNDYGLYNMSGNVSEWVQSSFDPSSYEYVSSMNPNANDPENKRKIIRGGSWKDVAYYLQVSTRDYEYADSARSYIGFRTVQDYMGTQTTGSGH